MSSFFKIKQSEFQKIRKQFDRLVERTQQKVITKAVRESMKPVLAEARGRIPTGGTGMLKSATKLKVKGYKRNGFVVGIVGVSRISKIIGGKKIRPSAYAHLVEYGTKTHGPKKAKVMTNGEMFFGTRVKGTSARPFLRPTFDANKGKMERDVRVKLGQGIEDVARRL
jgi:HK97 gp10 family phage protein